MPVTIRGDGILFNDGTLQTRAATGTTGGGTPTVPGLVIGAWDLRQPGDAVVTTATCALDSQTLGPGGQSQSWQNVTGSRAAGVTYTNTTNRGIMVSY